MITVELSPTQLLRLIQLCSDMIELNDQAVRSMTTSDDENDLKETVEDTVFLTSLKGHLEGYLP